MKMAGCKTEKEFYAKYPSENAFFAQYPHMKGNQTMQNGGAASGHEGSYWNGDSWVSTAGDSGTYASGVYYANGGPVFPIGGSAPIFGMGGSASFNVSNNEYPTPFAMAPGTGNGSGYLQDLPTHMAFGGITPGADIVNPFAMNPGTGMGSGMLQDLPTEMKKGGHHKGGKKKHLTPQQIQMMMQAMSQAQGQPQGQGMPQGMPPQGGQQMMSPQDQQMMAMQQAQAQQGQQQQMSPQDQQMMMQQQQMQQQGGGQPMPGMKEGGIHIKPSHRGMFTAYKQRTGKTTEEALHSPDPHVRQMANFAKNSAKWHHEYGGSTMMQTGGMITADRMVYQPGGQYQQDGQFPSFEEYGGQTNPFHPLARFARGGYYVGGGYTQQDTDLTTDPITGQPLTTNQPNISTAQTGVVPQDPQAVWNKNMTPAQAEQNINYGEGSSQAYNPATGDTTQEYYNQVEKQKEIAARNKKWNNARNWGNTALGLGETALGIAGTLADKRDARNLVNKQFNDRSSANAFAAINQPGGYGDYTTDGRFRPNQQIPTAAGMFYPGGAGMSKYGGGVMNNYTYAQGGYHAGQELEMSDAEIANLKRMGYKFDII
jgi:hypothetical protein